MDRYLAALRAPRDARPDLIALAAFAAEIARIPAIVREPMKGAVRLQWWRDTLALPDREATGHPIANALRDTITRRRLPPALLVGAIDTREGDLDHDLPADAGARRAWLAKREGALFELAWRILELPPSTEADEAAADAGHAYGLARTLSQLPGAIRNGGLPLARSELAAASVSLDDVGSPEAAAALEPVVETLRDEAERVHDRLRARLARLPRLARIAFLPVAVVPHYLSAQRRGSRPSLHAATEPTPLARVASIWWGSVTGRL